MVVLEHPTFRLRGGDVTTSPLLPSTLIGFGIKRGYFNFAGMYYKAPVSLGTMVVGDSSEGQKEYILGVLAPDLNDYTISPMSLNSTLVALKVNGKFF